jgi:hypothetical protein
MAPPAALLSIDPGVRYLGCAWWTGGQLVRAWRVQAPPLGHPGHGIGRQLADVLAEVDPDGVAQVWCETPQDYDGRRAPRRALDGIRDTIAAVRAYTGPAARWHTALPGKWKANVPKYVHHERIRWLLSPEERARVPWDDRDVADAVALGLWVLGRAGRGGTRPGAAGGSV